MPIIDAELRKKAEKAVIAKEKKKNKDKNKSPDVKVERDEFDDILDESNKSLSEKLGLSPAKKGAKSKKTTKADGMKQTKLNFAAKKADAPKPDDYDSFDEILDEAVPLRYVILFLN